eukprot:129623-Pelagomonas_calceolata.AAC.1
MVLIHVYDLLLLELHGKHMPREQNKSKGRFIANALLHQSFRNRATSPRDMTAPEADEFRSAIDELLKDVY